MSQSPTRWHSRTCRCHHKHLARQQKRRQTERLPSLIDTVVLIYSNCGRNHGSHKQRRHWISGRPGKAHHAHYWWQARERLPIPTPVSGNSTIQPWGRLLAVPAFLLLLGLLLTLGIFTTEGKNLKKIIIIIISRNGSLQHSDQLRTIKYMQNIKYNTISLLNMTI